MNIQNAAGSVRAGIYSTLTSTPTFTGLLGQSSSTPVVSGWNDLALTAPVSVVGGATYYIAFVLSDIACVYYTNTSGGTQYKVAFTYGPLPDPSGTLGKSTKNGNMRITYSATPTSFATSTSTTSTIPSSTTSTSVTSTFTTSTISTTVRSSASTSIASASISTNSTSTTATSTTSTSSSTSTASSYPTFTDTIGNNASSDNQNNQLLGYAITPSHSGVLTSVGLNVKAPAGSVRAGIYSNLTGTPTFSGLLGQSASTPVVSGWNDVALATPISVVAGTTYFIVFVLSNNTCVYYTNTSGGTQYKVAFTYGPLPDPSGTLGKSTKNANMRITYSATRISTALAASASTNSTNPVTQGCTYLIYTDGTTVYMQNCKTGGILYSSTSAYRVFDVALSNMTSGGTLFTRAGIYVISNTIYGRRLSNVTWSGDGWNTILQAGSNIVDTANSPQCGGGSHIDLICIYGGTGVTVSNMQFDGNAVNQSGAGVSPAYLGIEAQYASHITFDHLNVHDFKTDGMQFAGTSDSVMMNNYVANNRADGIMETSWTPPYYAARNTITGNTVTSSSDIGISVFGLDTLVEGNTIINMNTNNSPFQGTVHVPILIGDDVNASRIVVRNNDIENNPLPGWAIQSAPSDTAKGNHAITIDGNRIVNCAAGINVVYTQGVTISNNVIQTTTNPNAPYGGIKVYTGTTGISITGNLVSDSASYGILSQVDQVSISGNTVTMTNRAASGQTGINIVANYNTVSNNKVDLSSVTETMTGILLSPGYSSNVVSGNTIVGNPANSPLQGSGIAIGGTNDAVTGNQVGGFLVCINTSGTPNQGQVTNNIVSSSQCTKKINAYGNSMVITGNTGYNPVGTIASPFDDTRNTINDGWSGSTIPKNGTTMTVNYSPKIIKVVIGTGWTTDHTLVIKIDGTQIVSTRTPAANTVYTYTLNPGETFYIQYQTGKATFTVSGQ